MLTEEQKKVLANFKIRTFGIQRKTPSGKECQVIKFRNDGICTVRTLDGLLKEFHYRDLRK